MHIHTWHSVQFKHRSKVHSMPSGQTWHSCFGACTSLSKFSPVTSTGHTLYPLGHMCNFMIGVCTNHSDPSTTGMVILSPLQTSPKGHRWHSCSFGSRMYCSTRLHWRHSINSGCDALERPCFEYPGGQVCSKNLPNSGLFGSLAHLPISTFSSRPRHAKSDMFLRGQVPSTQVAPRGHFSQTVTVDVGCSGTRRYLCSLQITWLEPSHSPPSGQGRQLEIHSSFIKTFAE